MVPLVSRLNTDGNAAPLVSLRRFWLRRFWLHRGDGYTDTDMGDYTTGYAIGLLFFGNDDSIDRYRRHRPDRPTPTRNHRSHGPFCSFSLTPIFFSPTVYVCLPREVSPHFNAARRWMMGRIRTGASWGKTSVGGSTFLFSLENKKMTPTTGLYWTGPTGLDSSSVRALAPSHESVLWSKVVGFVALFLPSWTEPAPNVRLPPPSKPKNSKVARTAIKVRILVTDWDKYALKGTSTTCMQL